MAEWETERLTQETAAQEAPEAEAKAEEDGSAGVSEDTAEEAE